LIVDAASVEEGGETYAEADKPIGSSPDLREVNEVNDSTTGRRWQVLSGVGFFFRPDLQKKELISLRLT